jgi:hypothetical protein
MRAFLNFQFHRRLLPGMSKSARQNRRRVECADAPRQAEEPAMAENYLIFIVEPEWDEANATAEDWAREMKLHNAFAAAVREAGAEILDSDALGSGRYGVKIQPATDDAPARFTDGPFSETKEIVSGYYKIAARDREQAKELAALCPTGGWIELYPVVDVTQF